MKMLLCPLASAAKKNHFLVCVPYGKAIAYICVHLRSLRPGYRLHLLTSAVKIKCLILTDNFYHHSYTTDATGQDL